MNFSDYNDLFAWMVKNKAQSLSYKAFINNCGVSTDKTTALLEKLLDSNIIVLKENAIYLTQLGRFILEQHKVLESETTSDNIVNEDLADNIEKSPDTFVNKKYADNIEKSTVST